MGLFIRFHPAKPLFFFTIHLSLISIFIETIYTNPTTYTIKEACGILSVSRDSIDYLIHTYRLDVVVVGIIYRITWYSLAEYIIEPADDIDEVFDEFIRSRYRAA
jgi:hypothetical protein